MSPTLQFVMELKNRMAQSIIGQDQVVERIVLALLCNGNILVEGLPGLAKTRAVKSLAKNLESDFSRIQFTPDLLPSDITGSEMYLGESRNNDSHGSDSLSADNMFEFQSGPIFANIVLADEVNRAPAKVQAALLEAMEERQITVAKKSHKLPPLFMVMATQNPVEQEGTYPLPEAQMDRFLMHIYISYPSDEAERDVIRLVRQEEQSAQQKNGPDDSSQASQDKKPEPIKQSVIFDARAEIADIQVSDEIEEYMVALVSATRRASELDEELGRYIQVGVSPRGSIALDKTARAHAWINQRDQVSVDDVRSIVGDCFRHRIKLSYEALADGVSSDEVVARLIKLVAIS